MKLSLAITTYNRPELTIRAFEKVLKDKRLTEICILDDASSEENYYQLFYAINCINAEGKIKLFRNEQNEGMSLAKKKAIELCENEWVIIFDSDNEIDSSYIDALEKAEEIHKGLQEDIIYCPDKALPKFDYTRYIGHAIDRNTVQFYFNENVGQNKRNFQCLLNTCNYVVNRKRYLEVYQYRSDIGAADTIWHTYNHFKRNYGAILVVPNMRYQHKVHDESGWRKDKHNNVKKFNEVIELIKNL